MQDSDIKGILGWLIQQGLAGASETELIDGLCARCCAAGLPLSRVVVLIDTLHPVHEGRAFRWRDGGEEQPVVAYGPSQEGEAADAWRQSTFYHLTATGADEYRCRLLPGGPLRFPVLNLHRDEGHTDYVAMAHRLTGRTFGEMDCVYASWTTRHPEGFSDADLAALRRLGPLLALTIKTASLARIAETLVEVYLGRDAGQAVLAGRISRGASERIGAVLWFSDLRGFTTIADTAPPEEVIPLLNDYADAVVSSVQEAGGDVLKLIGDGVLAIFKAAEPAAACRCALTAERALRRRLEELNARRAAEGRPVTTVYLGLHIGEVFYGNIGSAERLDFTVVGPAVNEVSRISAMCRSVDRTMLVSAEFAGATPEPERRDLVSVGRFALRGVGRAEELFTLDPAVA